MGGCLSENVVAALLAGSLPRAELEAVERHLDGCAACHELVARVLRPADQIGVEDSAAARPTHMQIGRYRVLREVGAGSMGQVYAAQDPDLDREVALEVLRAAGPDDNDHRTGDAAAARRHFEESIAPCQSVGTPPFLALSLAGLARCGEQEVGHGRRE